MNKLRHIFLAAAFMSVLGAGAKDNVDYVDPFIGTTNFSICNPGAIMPHGLMSVVPFNVMGSDLNQDDKDKRWWSAVYEYNNKYFTGFAHVTLSGVGCPEMGTLLTMPTMGELNVDYRSYGSEYKDETARPGYYSTILTKYGIRTEVTATTRSSIERYTFPRVRATCSSILATVLPTRWEHHCAASATRSLRARVCSARSATTRRLSSRCTSWYA